MDNSEDGAEQAEQRRNHSDIGQINDAIIQTGRDSRPFRLGNFADLLKLRVRIFGGKLEHLLHDPRDGFSMPIGNG